MAAISLPIEMIHQSFDGILSAIRSDELSRRDLIAYVEQVQKLFLQNESAKSVAIYQALADVEQGNVERISLETSFEVLEEDFDSLLQQSLADIVEGRISGYGK